MTSEDWRPLFAREAGGPPPEPVLFDGVPDHLQVPLRYWLVSFLSKGRHAERVGLRLQLADTRGVGMPQTLIDADGDQLLQVIDAALYFHPQGLRYAEGGRPPTGTAAQVLIDQFAQPVTTLQSMLADASSAWKVGRDGRALHRRVDTTVQKAADAAVTSASASGRPEAARDLAESWAKVYGIHPDPSEAYRLAIRAVEDVAIPLVLPTDTNATLGKVRTHLREASVKWRTSMGQGTDQLVAMINLLWISQTDRHAGQADLARIDQAAAEQAVHLASTLVQWFAAGHVQRVP